MTSVPPMVGSNTVRIQKYAVDQAKNRTENLAGLDLEVSAARHRREVVGLVVNSLFDAITVREMQEFRPGPRLPNTTSSTLIPRNCLGLPP